MRTKNDSKFPVIIPRATLAVGAPSATFWTIATPKVINIFDSFKRSNLFRVLKTFSPLEVFRNFNDVKLLRQEKICCHEFDTKQIVINFVWTNKHFYVFKDIISSIRVSFNCETNFITFALFL